MKRRLAEKFLVKPMTALYLSGICLKQQFNLHYVHNGFAQQFFNVQFYMLIEQCTRT